MKQYFSCDTHEFSGIRSNLAVVPCMLEIESLERELTQVNYELQGTAEAWDAERYKEEAKKAIPLFSHQTQDRSSTLKRLVEEAEARRVSQRSVTRILEQMAALYVELSDEFLKDLNSALKGQTKNKRHNTLLKRSTSLRTRLDEKLVEYPSLAFEHLPEAYRSFSSDESACYLEAGRQFLHKWRNRAPLFDCPVTIYGYSIDTLPDGLQKVWREAYNLLKLGERKKYVRYQWQKHPPVLGLEESTSLDNAELTQESEVEQ